MPPGLYTARGFAIAVVGEACAALTIARKAPALHIATAPSTARRQSISADGAFGLPTSNDLRIRTCIAYDVMRV